MADRAWRFADLDGLACRACRLAGCPACRALCRADHAPHLAARFRPRDLLFHRDFPTGDLGLPACRTALALHRAASRGLPCLLSCCHGTTPENADADGRRRMRRPSFTLGPCRKTVNARNGRNGGAEGDRTLDLCIANAALSQLSYRPTKRGGIVMRPRRGSKRARCTRQDAGPGVRVPFWPHEDPRSDRRGPGFHRGRECGPRDRDGRARARSWPCSAPGFRRCSTIARSAATTWPKSTGRVVGQLMTTYEWSDWRNGQFLWIQSVYVLREFRGAGVFRALYDHLSSLPQRPAHLRHPPLRRSQQRSCAGVYSRLGMHRSNYGVMQTVYRGPESHEE